MAWIIIVIAVVMVGGGITAMVISNTPEEGQQSGSDVPARRKPVTDKYDMEQMIDESRRKIEKYRQQREAMRETAERIEKEMKENK